MANNRITLFGRDGKVMMQKEHLSKHPPGNAQQRKKSMKSGWQPSWVAAERPRLFDLTSIDQLIDVSQFNGIQIERIRYVE